MIECTELIKQYNNVYAVRGLSFKVAKGEVFGLLGSNGAGKTTTIKMILGLTKPTFGEIKIESNMKIGYSPETPYFHPFLTGSEVLKLYSSLQGISKEEAAKQTVAILKRVGLKKASDMKVKYYSKGMLQRLAVGQALLGNPDLLILDEPTSGLDAFGRIQMRELIAELKEEGKTIILNSHILKDVEKLADRAIIIKDGLKLREINLVEDKDKIDLEEIFIEAIGGEEDDDSYQEYL